MSTGLIALFDDLVALTKLAATSLDDAAAQAAKAGSKAAGIVIDDAAVTPRYVVGLTADRELPIISKIATGSFKNKLLFLLPGALVLSFFAPWVITPLLMFGGAFLCLEGYHKVMDMVRPGHHVTIADVDQVPQSAEELENERVGSAIRTDFILSAEIMAITLSTVSTSPLWMQATVLAVVGVGMTLISIGNAPPRCRRPSRCMPRNFSERPGWRKNSRRQAVKRFRSSAGSSASKAAPMIFFLGRPKSTSVRAFAMRTTPSALRMTKPSGADSSS